MVWTTIAVSIGLAVIGAGVDYLFKSDAGEAPWEPIEQLDVPTVTESDPIPVVFGTVELTSPNVVWWRLDQAFPYHGDDARTQARVDAHLVWCHGPVDAVSDVYYGDSLLTTSTGYERTFDSSHVIDDLWYDSSRHTEAEATYYEGAIHARLYDGLQNGLALTLTPMGYDSPPGVPADVYEVGFRHVLSMRAHDITLGTSRDLKPIRMKVRRIFARSFGQAPWYSSKAAIGDDMNGAHIIHECLTDTMWGLGLDVALIDDAAFRAAADKLFDEQLGLSAVLTKATSVKKFIEKVLEHIDGALYLEPTTGLYVLKLARDDFNVGGLPVLDDSNCRGRHVRPDLQDLPTRVIVKYQDRIYGRERGHPVTNAAAYQDRGEITAEQNYGMIRTADAAALLATRDLRQMSTPLAAVQIEEAHWSAAASLRPTDAFVWSSQKEQVNQMVCRVSSIDFGGPTSNSIKIEAVENAFGGDDPINDDGGSGWEDPVNDPDPSPVRLALELPLWMALQVDLETSAHAAATDYDTLTSGYVALAGTRPSDDAIGFDLYVEGATREVDVEFDIVVSTDRALSIESTSTVGWNETGIDFDTTAAAVFQIEDELVFVNAWGTGEATVERGWGDTVPVGHGVGRRMYLLGYLYDDGDGQRFERTFGVDRTARADGSAADIRALTKTLLGRLDVDDAPIDTVDLDHRSVRPLPPGDFTIVDNSDPVEYAGSVDLSWAKRDRFADPQGFGAPNQPSTDPTVDYVIRVIGEDSNGVKSTFRIITASGTSVSYSNQDELADSGRQDLSPYLIFDIHSERDGYSSWQSYLAPTMFR